MKFKAGRMRRLHVATLSLESPTGPGDSSLGREPARAPVGDVAPCRTGGVTDVPGHHRATSCPGWLSGQRPSTP